VFAEALHMREIAADGRIVVDPAVQNLLPADRSCVIAAAHQGNWEIAASALPQFGGVGAGIYQTLKNPLVDAHVHALRAPFYPGGLWPKRGAAARESLKHVRRGGVLLTLADLRDVHGVKVPFFGRLAPTSTFPALAARVAGKPLFAAQIVREPGVRFRVSLREIPVPRTDDREADILAATTALHAAFEDSIRQHPEQWMWVHRRWG
jgi:KDO2-lipid IV(A) lauroyltransferase